MEKCCVLLKGGLNTKATKFRSDRVLKKYSNGNLKPSHLSFSLFSCLYKNDLSALLLPPTPPPTLLHTDLTWIRHRQTQPILKNIKGHWTDNTRCFWIPLVAHLHVFLMMVISVQLGLFGDLALGSLHLLLAFGGGGGVGIALPLVFVLFSFFAVISLLLFIIIPGHLLRQLSVTPGLAPNPVKWTFVLMFSLRSLNKP